MARSKKAVPIEEQIAAQEQVLADAKNRYEETAVSAKEKYDGATEAAKAVYDAAVAKAETRYEDAMSKAQGAYSSAIAKAENAYSDAAAKLQELKNQQEEQRRQELVDLIVKSGKSTDEVAALLGVEQGQ